MLCQFSSWERLDCLGTGGQARVYRVRTDAGDVLAAKYLDLPPGEGTAVSAMTEAGLLAKLSHRNIVQFAATKMDPTAEQRLVLFTELIAGQPLRCVINGQPLDQAKIRTYSLQLAEALYYIHTRRPPVIHRDVNCNNVMIQEDDTLKLIDFGLSTCLQPIEDGSSTCGSTVNSTTSSRHQLGTVGFLAPEILYRKEKLGVSQYSAQSDVWAFGCTVYQMATGQAPYQSSEPGVYIYRVVKQGAPPLPKAAYSEELRQFYQGCVCKDRRRRFTAGDLLQHNFLLYRPEELRELRQLVQDFQRQCAEQTQLHSREEQHAAERKRKRILSANSDAARERQRLEQRLTAAQRVAKKTSARRRREAAQRARERARRSRGSSGAEEDQDNRKLAKAAEAADLAEIDNQLARDLAAAMDSYRRDLLAVELKHSEQLLELETEDILDRAARQLELDTKLIILKNAEATAKFDKELERHRREVDSQRAAQLRSHALERRCWQRQLEAERTTRARQYRESLLVEANRRSGTYGDYEEEAAGLAVQFADSPSELERVRQGMERLEERLARENEELNNRAARTEEHLRQELHERLGLLSSLAADKRRRLESEKTRRLAEARESARRRQSDASAVIESSAGNVGPAAISSSEPEAD